jgi:CubicO group peptidase (beta-lactamase class C family)
VLDLGQFARVLLGLATGAAVRDDLFPLSARSEFDAAKLRDAIAGGAHQDYPDYLSIHIWRPLNAAPAWISLAAQGSPAPADCCFHAQLSDWLRVAELLSLNGRFEGKQLLPPDWMDRMRRPLSADRKHGFGVELAAAARGAEPFETDDVFFLRGPGRWRLWVVPSLQLAVVFGAADRSASADTWDETRLPNLVMRTLSDRPASKEVSKLQQLVPGH